MILSWVAYVAVVTTLLAASARALDGVLTRAGRPTRWVWTGALAASLVLAAVAVPHLGGWADTTGRVAAARRTASLRPALRAVLRAQASLTPADPTALALLCAASALGAARLLRARRALEQARRTWARTTVAGADVWLAPDTATAPKSAHERAHVVGPAVVGVFRRAIVLPFWVTTLPPAEQALVVAHERAHITGGDRWALLVLLVARVALLWNPAAWWMAGRLRAAVERDCDQRVMRTHGHARAKYARLLLAVAARGAGRGTAFGFAAAKDDLRARLGALVPRPGVSSPHVVGRPTAWPLLAAGLCVLLALALPDPLTLYCQSLGWATSAGNPSTTR